MKEKKTFWQKLGESLTLNLVVLFYPFFYIVWCIVNAQFIYTWGKMTFNNEEFTLTIKKKQSSI